MAVEELIESLNADDEIERRAAVAALIRVGAESVGTLVTALADPRPRVRWGAATALGPIANDDGAAIAGLVRALGDSVQHVCQCAVTAFAFIGKSAVPALIRCLSSNNSDIQGWAALALGKIGAQAAEAELKLRSLLSHTDDSLRRQAAIALGAVGISDVTPLKEELRTALASSNYRHAEALVIAIREGGKSGSVFTALQDAIFAGDERLRDEAFAAIQRLDPNAALSASGKLTCYLRGQAAVDQVSRILGIDDENNTAN